MAGDWIKMRTSLLTNPKVNSIARILESDARVSRVLSTGFNGRMSEMVTRVTLRYVTVTALLIVWGAANEHTKDGVFHNTDLLDIDDMAGIPGFGDAMCQVGWAVFNDVACCVTLPNFSEYNSTGVERSASAKTNAERQREFRNTQKTKRNENRNADSNENRNEIVTDSNVTCGYESNVTVTAEKRREDKTREDKTKDISSIPTRLLREASTVDDESPCPDQKNIDPITTRAIELTVLLRKRGASLQASDPNVRAWASDGISDAQALVALEAAQQARAESGSSQPINSGYLNAIINQQPRIRGKPRATKPSAEDLYEQNLRATAGWRPPEPS